MVGYLISLINRCLGIFVTFSESMHLCLKSSLPLLIIALTFFALSLAVSNSASPKPPSAGWFHWRGNATESAIDFTKNDLLLGSQDPIFWFLVPLFGLVSAGLCVVINYTALGITWILYIPYDLFTSRPAWAKHDEGRSVAVRAVVVFLY